MVILILGSFPLPQKAQASEPPIDLPAFETTQLAFINHEIAITVVDSPGSLRVEAERVRKAQELEAKAEANRLEKLRIAQEATKKQKLANNTSKLTKASPPPLETVNLETSGTEYGEVKVLYADRTNNCVGWVKNKLGINRSIGNGARAGIQGKEPKVGAIGAVKGAVHAVLVTAINDGMITIAESNYRKNVITARVLPASQFLGFIYN